MMNEGEDDEWMRTDNCYARVDDWVWMLAHSLAVAGALCASFEHGHFEGDDAAQCYEKCPGNCGCYARVWSPGCGREASRDRR